MPATMPFLVTQVFALLLKASLLFVKNPPCVIVDGLKGEPPE